MAISNKKLRKYLFQKKNIPRLEELLTTDEEKKRQEESNFIAWLGSRDTNDPIYQQTNPLISTDEQLKAFTVEEVIPALKKSYPFVEFETPKIRIMRKSLLADSIEIQKGAIKDAIGVAGIGIPISLFWSSTGATPIEAIMAGSGSMAIGTWIGDTWMGCASLRNAIGTYVYLTKTLAVKEDDKSRLTWIIAHELSHCIDHTQQNKRKKSVARFLKHVTRHNYRHSWYHEGLADLIGYDTCLAFEKEEDMIIRKYAFTESTLTYETIYTTLCKKEGRKPKEAWAEHTIKPNEYELGFTALMLLRQEKGQEFIDECVKGNIYDI